MKRCQVGDIAIIIIARPPYQDWIGRLVTIIDINTYGGSDDWEFEFCGESPYPGDIFTASDYHLLPVPGLPLQEEEQTDIKVPV